MPYIIALVISSIVGLGAYIPAPQASFTLGAVKAFTSEQLAPSPVNGNCLTTNGSINAWGSCGTGGGGGGGSVGWTWNGAGLLRMTTTTDDLLLGVTATTSRAKLNVHAVGTNPAAYFNGNVGISSTTPGTALGVEGSIFVTGTVTSTSTRASVLPYASTTGITSSYASTSLFFANGLGGCSVGQYLTWSNGSFSCATDQNSGGSSGIATTSLSANDFDASASTISIDYTNGQAASVSNKGFLTAADWATFNSKLSSYDAFSRLTTFATTTAATNTPIWTQGVFFSSSTKAASQFPYASSTAITAVTASSTNLYVSGAPGALALIGTDGLLGKYGGAAACTNQVVTAISVVGATTCSSVSNAMLSNSSITINTTGIATGGGSVSLGSTITINASSSPTVGFVIATSTTQNSIFPYASSTAISTGYASSTFFFGAGLASCSGGNFLTYDGSGRFGCAADSVGAGGSYPFTPLTTFGTTTSATSSSIWTQGVFFSSSTKAASQFPYASTTALSVSGNSFLGTVSSGVWNGTTIAIANGGTNQTSFPTTGGMIYFDGTKLTQSAGGDPFYDAANIRFIVGRASGSFRLNSVGSNGNGYFGIDSASGVTTGNIFLINASGDVGIATTTPGAKLGVTGNMFIAGNITSTSTLASIFPYASTTGLTASSLLTIPNGTAPVATNPGDIAHDTSDNMLILDDLVVGKATDRIWGVTVGSTSPAFISGGLLPFPTQLDGYTITRIECYVVGGTSKVIAIEDASANSSEDITCATTATDDDGSITNATYTASELGNIDFGATTGAVDYVTISVFGQWTRE